jgi:hypothetical protein
VTKINNTKRKNRKKTGEKKEAEIEKESERKIIKIER